MNWLNDKCNRAYSFKLQFEKDLCDLTIYHNKNNLYTSFTLDQRTYERTRRSSYNNIIFFDLSKSQFCKTFLDVKNFYTNGIDVKNQFNCIFAHHKDLITCESTETITLGKQKVTWHKVPQDNSLTVRVFRLSLYPNNFMYVLAERQLIEPVLGKKLVRTSAFQLGDNESTKYINSIFSKYSTKEVKRQTTEEALRSVFSSNDTNISDKKLDRCGVL